MANLYVIYYLKAITMKTLSKVALPHIKTDVGFFLVEEGTNSTYVPLTPPSDNDLKSRIINFSW